MSGSELLTAMGLRNFCDGILKIKFHDRIGNQDGHLIALHFGEFTEITRRLGGTDDSIGQ